MLAAGLNPHLRTCIVFVSALSYRHVNSTFVFPHFFLKFGIFAQHCRMLVHCACFGNGLRQPCRQFVGTCRWRSTEEARLPPSLSAVHAMHSTCLRRAQRFAVKFYSSVLPPTPPHMHCLKPLCFCASLAHFSAVNDHRGGGCMG